MDSPAKIATPNHRTHLQCAFRLQFCIPQADGIHKAHDFVCLLDPATDRAQALVLLLLPVENAGHSEKVMPPVLPVPRLAAAVGVESVVQIKRPIRAIKDGVQQVE